MNWPAIIENLSERGWTQALLAKRLDIAQSTVSELRCGKTTDPKHSTGEAIKALLASGERPAEAAPTAQEAA